MTLVRWMFAGISLLAMLLGGALITSSAPDASKVATAAAAKLP
ncbi:MAG: hypothetical protein QM723_08095 [Myxococcaceae bacterium]